MTKELKNFHITAIRAKSIEEKKREAVTVTQNFE